MIILRVKMVKWKKIRERLLKTVTPVKRRLPLALMCPGVGCQKAHTIKHWADQQWLALFSSEVANSHVSGPTQAVPAPGNSRVFSVPSCLWSYLWKGLSTYEVIFQLLDLEESLSSSSIFCIFESPESSIGPRTLQMLKIYKLNEFGGGGVGEI